MIVFMIVVIVLIGVVYADYCLIDNTAHFGRCYGKVAEAEEDLAADLQPDARETVAPPTVEPVEALEAPGDALETPGEANGIPSFPPRNPAHEWLLLELEPVLDLHEERTGTSG